MAQTRKTKTTKKATTKSKAVESDFMFVPDDDGNIVVDLYCRDNGKISAKVTLCNAFVIYATVVVMKKEGYAFLSYPSYKSRKGDYVSQAFCFDKAINEEINEQVTSFVFDEN